ncbi:36005_t:CDS:1, partial [Racocetra persica]
GSPFTLFGSILCASSSMSIPFRQHRPGLHCSIKSQLSTEFRYHSSTFHPSSADFSLPVSSLRQYS